LFTVQAIHIAPPTYTMVHRMSVFTATLASRLEWPGTAALKPSDVDEEGAGSKVSLSLSESCWGIRVCSGRLRKILNMTTLCLAGLAATKKTMETTSRMSWETGQIDFGVRRATLQTSHHFCLECQIPGPNIGICLSPLKYDSTCEWEIGTTARGVCDERSHRDCRRICQTCWQCAARDRFDHSANRYGSYRVLVYCPNNILVHCEGVLDAKFPATTQGY
jgi:hypothetical protein